MVLMVAKLKKVDGKWVYIVKFGTNTLSGTVDTRPSFRDLLGRVEVL